MEHSPKQSLTPKARITWWGTGRPTAFVGPRPATGPVPPIPAATNVRHVPINQIQVVGEGRACNAKTIALLAESMATNSVRPLIGIRENANGKFLVTGRLWLEAAKLRDDDHIYCIVVDEIPAALSEIAEILCHAKIAVLHRSELVAEYVRLLMQMFKGGQNDQPLAGGQQPHDKGVSKAARELPIPGKTQEARRKWVRRAVEIDSITNEAKAAVRAAGIDNVQSALLEIAKEDGPKRQLAKVSELARVKNMPRRKRSALDGGGEARNVLDFSSCADRIGRAHSHVRAETTPMTDEEMVCVNRAAVNRRQT
jgi:hypothetical protein